MTAQPKDAHMPDELPNRTPLFTAWVASWADVRRELEAVLEAYERRHPAYDPGWIEPVFEMMDTTLYNLSYRAQWLKADLDRGEDAPPAIDDDAFYTLLAEAQVG
jgi:cytochrome b